MTKPSWCFYKALIIILFSAAGLLSFSLNYNSFQVLRFWLLFYISFVSLLIVMCLVFTNPDSRVPLLACTSTHQQFRLGVKSWLLFLGGALSAHCSVVALLVILIKLLIVGHTLLNFGLSYFFDRVLFLSNDIYTIWPLTQKTILTTFCNRHTNLFIVESDNHSTVSLIFNVVPLIIY